MAILKESEFKEYFKAYYNMLCNYASKYSESPEDVVQEVFTSLWNRRNDLPEILKIKSYLLSAVHYKCAEVMRQEKLKFTSLDDGNDLQNVAREINEDVLEEEFDKNMLKEHIYHSIRQLPPKCQRIFVLAKIEGRSHKEIAEDLVISIKTVENQINKAYKKLRELLKDKFE